MKAPGYLAIDPMAGYRRTAAATIEVTEGVAIRTYLADAFPAAGRRPGASGN